MITALPFPSQPPSKANERSSEAASSDDGLTAFLRARPRLFGIAYRMLDSVPDAEDIVQDVWVRWQTTDRRRVRNSLTFLVTATTRLAINLRQSAHARRETCAGSWVREPVDTGVDPGLGAEWGEALNVAVLVLLEKLSPTERAAYVLREAFRYSHREIAHVLRVEEGNARQIVTRAREHLSGGRQATVSPAEQARLHHAFVAAARTGELAMLEHLLASDARLGQARSSPTDDGRDLCKRRPSGRHNCVRHLVMVVRARQHSTG